jgi:predicted MPP superfamily phosphohydrolase
VFWFWFLLHFVMLAADAACWVAAIRLTKRNLWRVLITIFLAVQMSAMLSGISGFNWPLYAPKAVFVFIVLWHYLALALVVAVLGGLGIARPARWLVHGVASARGCLPSSPSAAPAREASVSRREFIGTCAVLAPPLFNVGLTGIALAQLNEFRVRRFTLPIPTLPRVLDGLTIAHVSDVHVGRLTSGRVLREMVNMTNALRPDLILLTGDLINYELSDLSDAIALIKSMEARYGQWMIEGNHDLFDNAGEFERRVKAAGIPLLLNEAPVANVRGHPVQFLGLSWMDGHGPQRDRLTALQLRDLLRLRQPDTFPILLAHHPHTFDAAVAAGLPLTFAGHTHGGQMMLDRRHGGGPTLFRYWSGLYERQKSQMIVSNGVGNVFPIRINAPAEIVHVTLRCSGTRG